MKAFVVLKVFNVKTFSEEQLHQRLGQEDVCEDTSELSRRSGQLLLSF